MAATAYRPLHSLQLGWGSINIHTEHRAPPARHLDYGRNILIAVLASGTVLGVEIWAGLKTGSLALLSDAAHMFVDLSGLGLAYMALMWASRPADERATFGYQRVEVLAAAVNGIIVVLLAAALLFRAYRRWRDPLNELDTGLVLVVGAVGLAANLVAAGVLRKQAGENINTKGAFLNVLGDALASVGVLVSAFLVRWTGNTSWDTAVSVLVAGIIVVAAWGLLKGAVAILLERAPPHLDMAEVKSTVERLEDVVNVHDLHIWTLTPGHHSLSMHVSIRADAVPEFHRATQAIEDLLLARYGLDHCTIQVEPEGHDESDHHNPVQPA